MTIDHIEESDGKFYDGFVPAGDDTGSHNKDNAVTIVECAEGHKTTDGPACTGETTLGKNRHYYFRTDSGKDLIEDEDDIDDHVNKEWKPCEMRTRKECADSRVYHMQQAAGDVTATVGAGVVLNTKIQECVMSSPLLTKTNADGAFKNDVALANINPYIVASVQYLLDKTGLDHDKLMCRYYGDKNDAAGMYGGDDCTTFIEENEDTRTFLRKTTTFYESARGNLVDPDQKDEEDNKNQDDIGKDADAGGKDFMTFALHDQYVRHDRNDASRYHLTKEDVEFLAAYVSATYAYLIDEAERYKEQNDDGDGLSTEALASRESLLANIRGDCFSPGLSGGGLLYQGGFGAAYFAFGIILIVCHLLWLMYAVNDDESKRFMATRAMSLFGILTALAGLYSTFTWPKHQCHLHPKHRFPLIHPSIPVCHQQFSFSFMAVDRAKSTTLMSCGGSESS